MLKRDGLCRPFLKTVEKPSGVFPTKGLQSAARIILPLAAKFHTGSLRGIFPHAHVAVKNDPIFLPPAGGKLCEVFGGDPTCLLSMSLHSQRAQWLWQSVTPDLRT